MSQKFLVVVTGSTQNIRNTLDEVFHVFWQNGLMHSHVFIQDAANTWSLYTFLPYQNDCNALSHLKIDCFTSSNFSTPMKLTIDQVYLEKLKFNGCPLYVAPFIRPVIMRHCTVVKRHQSENLSIFDFFSHRWFLFRFAKYFIIVFNIKYIVHWNSKYIAFNYLIIITHCILYQAILYAPPNIWGKLQLWWHRIYHS